MSGMRLGRGGIRAMGGGDGGGDGFWTWRLCFFYEDTLDYDLVHWG